MYMSVMQFEWHACRMIRTAAADLRTLLVLALLLVVVAFLAAGAFLVAAVFLVADFAAGAFFLVAVSFLGAAAVFFFSAAGFFSALLPCPSFTGPEGPGWRRRGQYGSHAMLDKKTRGVAMMSRMKPTITRNDCRIYATHRWLERSMGKTYPSGAKRRRSPNPSGGRG